MRNKIKKSTLLSIIIFILVSVTYYLIIKGSNSNLISISLSIGLGLISGFGCWGYTTDTWIDTGLKNKITKKKSYFFISYENEEFNIKILSLWGFINWVYLLLTKNFITFHLYNPNLQELVYDNPFLTLIYILGMCYTGLAIIITGAGMLYTIIHLYVFFTRNLFKR